MALTKSPNLRVPSFLMYRRTSVDTTSVFSWNPAAGKLLITVQHQHHQNHQHSMYILPLIKCWDPGPLKEQIFIMKGHTVRLKVSQPQIHSLQ